MLKPQEHPVLVNHRAVIASVIIHHQASGQARRVKMNCSLRQSPTKINKMFSASLVINRQFYCQQSAANGAYKTCLNAFK